MKNPEETRPRALRRLSALFHAEAEIKNPISKESTESLTAELFIKVLSMCVSAFSF